MKDQGINKYVHCIPLSENFQFWKVKSHRVFPSVAVINANGNPFTASPPLICEHYCGQDPAPTNALSHGCSAQ